MKATKRHEIIRLLKERGYQLSRVGRHEIFRNEAGNSIPVPSHLEISPGSLRDIMRGLKRGELQAQNNQKEAI